MKQAAPGWIPGFASLAFQFVFTLGIGCGFLIFNWVIFDCFFRYAKYNQKSVNSFYRS